MARVGKNGKNFPEDKGYGTVINNKSLILNGYFRKLHDGKKNSVDVAPRG
jgi:hypothetical protein